jgi:hypothetical protein
MAIQTPSESETAAEIRAWVGESIHKIYNSSGLPVPGNLATVRGGWASKGIGWPQTVGEYKSPASVAIEPHRFEIIVVVPPEAPDGLAEQLRELANDDQTLGGRVRAAEIPEGDFESKEVTDQDLGADATEIIIPVVVYQLIERN